MGTCNSCGNMGRIWSKGTAIDKAKKMHLIDGQHYGVYEDISRRGHFTFRIIEEIRHKILFRTDGEDL